MASAKQRDFHCRITRLHLQALAHLQAGSYVSTTLYIPSMLIISSHVIENSFTHMELTGHMIEFTRGEALLASMCPDLLPALIELKTKSRAKDDSLIKLYAQANAHANAPTTVHELPRYYAVRVMRLKDNDDIERCEKEMLARRPHCE